MKIMDMTLNANVKITGWNNGDRKRVVLLDTRMPVDEIDSKVKSLRMTKTLCQNYDVEVKVDSTFRI